MRVDHHSDRRTELGAGLTAPPCNIGPLSTPNYATNLASPAIHPFSAHGFSGTVFAGQRAEGFYVDLGAVFDLGGLRPFESHHLSGMLANMPGVNSDRGRQRAHPRLADSHQPTDRQPSSPAYHH